MEFEVINYTAIECETILMSEDIPHYEGSTTSFHKIEDNDYECNYNIDRYNQFHSLNKAELMLQAWLTMNEEDYEKYEKEKGENTVRGIAARNETIKMTRANGDEITVYLATPLEMLELEGDHYIEELEIKDERGFPVYSNIYLREGGGTTLIYFKEHLHPIKEGEIKEWNNVKYIATKAKDSGCDLCVFRGRRDCTSADKTTHLGECETNNIYYEIM